MPLSTEQVNSAYASIKARGLNVVDQLEQSKTLLGDVFGNNDTITQTQGAIKMIINFQLDEWKSNGLDLASQGDDANPAKVKSWVKLGNTFTNAISEIDGYGQDATLQSVVIATAKQTVKDATPIFAGFGLVALAIGAGFLLLYFGMLTRK